MSLNGPCFTVTWTIFKNQMTGGRKVTEAPPTWEETCMNGNELDEYHWFIGSFEPMLFIHLTAVHASFLPCGLGLSREACRLVHILKGFSALSSLAHEQAQDLSYVRCWI